MAAPGVGDVAPSFRLPAGQGGEIALDDYRNRQPVIVWFTKGMACVFCRTQMTSLARLYPEIRKRGAELLEVSISTPEQAALWARKYPLPFPYLADAEYRARRLWGLESREHGLGYYVTSFVGAAIASMKLDAPNDFGHSPPPIAEAPRLLRDDDMGFFIVDRAGVVRYAVSGSYVTESGTRQIPSSDEILRELERAAA